MRYAATVLRSGPTLALTLALTSVSSAQYFHDSKVDLRWNHLYDYDAMTQAMPGRRRSRGRRPAPHGNRRSIRRGSDRAKFRAPELLRRAPDPWIGTR